MIRILNIIGTLDMGGVETWLKSLLYHVDNSEIQVDFCCLGEREGVYAEEIKKAGSKIHVCRLNAGIIKFTKNYISLLKRHKYEIVHSHVHFFSGYLALISRIAGVKVFISHSHTTSDGYHNRFLRIIYRIIMKELILLFSDHFIAASKEAGLHLFGNKILTRNNYSTIRCGIKVCCNENDLEFIANEYLLEKLKGKIVIGHIGRFNEQKNHKFLIEIMKILSKSDKYILVLIGDGPLKKKIYEKVISYGLRENVIFMGSIINARRFVKLFNIFLMPSLYEGLPVAALEAQAAGIPVILSANITREAAVIDDLVIFAPLELGPEYWANKIIELVRLSPKIDSKRIKREFDEKGFSIESSTKELIELYMRILRAKKSKYNN